MSSFTLSTDNFQVDTSSETYRRSLERLEVHRQALESNGVPPVSELGTLELFGSIVATPGVVHAPPANGSVLLTPAPSPGSMHFPPSWPQAPPTDWPPRPVVTSVSPPSGGIPLPVSLPDGTGTRMIPGFVEATRPAHAPFLDWGALGTTAAGLSISLTSPLTVAPMVALDIAYFVGQTVRLADNTVVALQWPHKYLTFICEKLIVGNNVTFTYEHPQPRESPQSYPQGYRPDTPPTPDPSRDLWEGAPGSPGTNGNDATAGFRGEDAPEVELWVLEMEGSPQFDLRGQDGWPGGRGQDGGNGGQGANGWPEEYTYFLGKHCARGAGAGGNGGRGGNGGNGGNGGPGGHGGRLSIYAPEPVLQRYAAHGFSISTDGGSGGPGGEAGDPGIGGPGGDLGSHPHNCAMSSGWRDKGDPGPPGDPGRAGGQGLPGAHYPDAKALRVITVTDFRRELLKPALVSASPAAAVAGTQVTLATRNVNDDDIVLIDEVPVATMTVIADTLVTILVPPDALGGNRTLQIRQSDGTLSNRMSFYVLPHVTAVGDGGRQRPGTTVTLAGSGFAPNARVRVNGDDMRDVVFVNGTTMTFTLHRPQRTEENASGEPGHLKVILEDSTPSNEVDFIIDTVNAVIVGDSVAWGQGLTEQQKYATLVKKDLEATSGGMRVYLDNLAHSGATIGVGDTRTAPRINAEVPTSYPTTMQQLDMVTSSPDSVDLVVVTAGLNDVNFRNIIDPLKKPADFAAAVTQSCYRDMRTLLTAIAGRFPNATIVATGYYPIISDSSDVGALRAFAVAAGLGVASIPGAVIGGVLAGAMVSQMVTNCRAFHELSTVAIRSAVDDVNDRLPLSRVAFADPGFTGRNSVFAPDSWLYGVNGDLSPQDLFTAGDRAKACSLNRDRADEFQCVRASAGHPNAAGARAYAKAILAALARGADAETNLPKFPPGFMFGVATASMQNEGGITNNDWAQFASNGTCQKWVRIITGKDGGHPADLVPPGDAVGHADLGVLATDLDRAVSLGVNAYRYSVEWARLSPARPGHDGDLSDGDFDATALAYYDGVLDELAARSMTPVLTVNHMTLPVWALNPPKTRVLGAPSLAGIDPADANDPDFKASMRGWENIEVVDEYVRLVKYLANRWKDKIRWWVTVNEPVGSMIGVGYIAGAWSPGFVADGPRGKDAYFNLIRAHVRAYEAIRSVHPDAQVGFAHAMMFAKTTYEHTDDLVNDQDAARNQFDYFYNWHMLNAVINGSLDVNISRRPNEQNIVEGSDFQTWAGLADQPWRSHCDFVGLNYYRSVYVFGYEPPAAAFMPYTGGRFHNNLASSQQVHQLLNPMGWEISPAGFGTMLREIHGRYAGIPVLVTENGLPQAEDSTRGAFIAGHLTELLSAVASGVKVVGYMYWTLVDNWEWHEGYWPNARFGLFTVDRAQDGMPRHLTEGGLAYSYAIKTNSVIGIRDRFGVISVGGDLVRTPRHSIAFLAGMAGSEAVELSLRSDADGHLIGMLWTSGNGGQLAPVRGSFDPVTRTLTLNHPAVGKLAAGTLRSQSSGGLSFTGVLGRDTATVAVDLVQDPLVGQWLGAEPVPRVQITRTPGGVGGYVGAWMSDTMPRGWNPMPIEEDTGTYAFTLTPGRATVTLDSAKLTGQVTILAGMTVAWEATRRPDALGLV